MPDRSNPRPASQRLPRPIPAGLAALAVATAMLLAASTAARAEPLMPPGGKTYFGVTDTGSGTGFGDFTRMVGQRSAVLQTFHPWDNSLHIAMPRWKKLRVRPMLHIDTVNEDGVEVVAPRGIAMGAGDDYLLRLNRTFSKRRIFGYIRPLGEPNRCLNAWAAVDCSGNRRGGKYSQKWYRLAFRRMYLILHGGYKTARVDAKLRHLGMPGVQRTEGKPPRMLPKAPIAVVWSPLPGGSPRVRGNFPANYWPGANFVDWVGTDFYSRYSVWKDLKRFYGAFAKRQRKPFALTEWGLWGEDSPGFVKSIFRFMNTRDQARMMVYYQDFGTSNEFRIQNFPRSARIIKRQLKTGRYPEYAKNFPK